MDAYGIDYDFIELLDLNILAGRSFSQEFKDENNFVINETAVKQLRWENPLGKQLTMGAKKGTVVGIVKDFHFKDIDNHISPSVLHIDKENLNYMLVRVVSLVWRSNWDPGTYSNSTAPEGGTPSSRALSSSSAGSKKSSSIAG